MIRVMVADDHALVREGLKRILAGFPDTLVVGEAADGDAVVGACEHLTPDVLLLDVSMPGATFLETIRALAAQLPRLRVLVLSMHADEQYAVRSLKAGAAGYLTKNHGPDTLAEAIRVVHSGRTYVTAAQGAALAQRLGGAEPTIRHEVLSDREFEVLVKLAQGMAVKQIGSELELSPKTVSTYRGRIMAKMGFANAAELVRYVVDSGLIA